MLYLKDRLLLHDLSFVLNSDPSDRNALIDAANSVHHKHSPVRSQPQNLIDLDLPSPPRVTPSANSDPRKQDHRYLVFPFADDANPHNPQPPFVTTSPERAGIPSSAQYASLPADAAASFLGLLPLHTGMFVVLVVQSRQAGTHPLGKIMSVSKVRLVRLGNAMPSKDDKDVASAITKILESGSVYYSLSMDLTRRSQRNGSHHTKHTFWWNFPMVDRLPHACKSWAPHAIYGFVGTTIMRFHARALASGSGEFTTTLISRRSRHRAGTRYITRGADALGNVANFVETEQVVWSNESKHSFTSFTLIRGSVPVFWRQDNGIAKPSPELDATLLASRKAFSEHFDILKDMYGYVCAVSLVDLSGSENVLAEAFQRHFELYLRPFQREKPPKLVAFDFHRHCAGKEYERGLSILLGKLRKDISQYGFYESGLDTHEQLRFQRGVFRVNCVDCLDRTNVVQSLIAHEVLSMQIQTVFSEEIGSSGKEGLRLYSESEDRFKHLWGDNADAISKQYSGTGALKTDFTRTGKRSTSGVIGDGVKSVMRMYYKNFVDESRQEVIDILCGNVILRKPSLANGEGYSSKTKPSPEEDFGSRSNSLSTTLWYSFEALRVNAGGDKQPVLIELYDDLMYVSTPDGICFQYPRKDLVSWSKYEERKTSDRKIPVRLRLMYKPLHHFPCTACPLDLQFKGGTTARENFLRALVSWSTPAGTMIPPKSRIRSRVLLGTSEGEHVMRDWNLSPDPEAEDTNEVIALVLPESSPSARRNGLAAVPVDVDFSDYVLVGASAVSPRGPAIAVLVTKRMTSSVMTVSEAVTTRSGLFAAGGVAAIALTAGGTSFCFVSANLEGPPEVYSALSSLNLGRQSFDVTNQFHHFSLAGYLGEMCWDRSKSSSSERVAGPWTKLKDGSLCYTMESGISVLRNSFPTLRYDDRLIQKPTNGDMAANDSKRTRALTLADGVVESRPGPRLPKEVSRPVVLLCDLKVDGLKLPLGIEQTSQINCSIALFCDFATSEGISTKQLTRFSSSVEWKETLRLSMMPSDMRVIYNSFIIGQVMAIPPLADPIPAGHFVIPVSYALAENKTFEVPCRLAGVQCGQLHGNISVLNNAISQKEFDAAAGKQSVHESSTSGSAFSDRNSLPPIHRRGERDDLQDFVSPQSFQRRAQSASYAVSGSSPGSSKQKLTMEEVNDKLDAARKRGTKQIKSVVNKLSSLVVQNSPSTSRSSRIGSQKKVGDESYRPSHQMDRFDSMNVASSQSIPTARTMSYSIEQRTDVSESVSSSSEANQAHIKPTTLKEKSRSQRTVDGNSTAFGSLCSARPSSEPPTKSSSLGGPVSPQGGRDSLLEGLRADRNASRTRTGSGIPRHADDSGVDPLLSGLAKQKSSPKTAQSGGMDDDEWGDFASASKTNSSRNQKSAKTPQIAEQSLLDL